MIVEKQEHPAPAPGSPPAVTERVSWWRLLLGLILTALAVWYTTREVALADVVAALSAASLPFLLLSVLTILLTTVAKAWRWQLMFMTEKPLPRWRDIFWTMMLGQFFNIFLWRAGDLARVYDLSQRANQGKAKVLGTVIIEKSLNMVLMAIVLAAVLPFVLLPDNIRTPGISLIVVAVTLFGALYMLAYQTDLAQRITGRLAAWLPLPLEKRLVKLAAGGLAGLAALRRRRLTVLLFLVSVLIEALSVLTPLTLFPALNIPFGLKEAVLLHIVLSLGSAPPSTPARLGVFEWLVVVLLQWFGGVSDSIMISYALLFHAVVLLPQIVLGSLAAMRSPWRWRTNSSLS